MTPADRRAELERSAVFGGEPLAQSDDPCPRCVAEGKTKGARAGRLLRGEETDRRYCPVHGVAP